MAAAPLISIDLASPTPAYEQIAASIRALLVSGKLPPGYLLPPVRQVAVDLSVHFNTVAQAYRVLADEGWLELRQGRGATVMERERRSPAPAARQNFSDQLGRLIASGLAFGLSRAEVHREFERLLKQFPSRQS